MEPYIKHRPPKRLYRFRSSDSVYFEEELENFLNKKIYLSGLANQNDPFECRPAYNKNSHTEINDYLDSVRKVGKYVLPTGTNLLDLVEDGHQSRSRLNRVMRRSPSRANRFKSIAEKIYHEQRHKHGIACFCSDISSQLMWAHYTRSCTGLVVGYEWSSEPLLAGDSLNPIKVRYVKDRPSITTIDLLRMGRKNQTLFHLLDDETRRDEALDAMYFTKSDDWSYEREWRIFGVGRTGYQGVESMVPTAIILGAKCTLQIRDKVSTIVAGRLEVVTSAISSSEYSVDVPPHLLPG